MEQLPLPEICAKRSSELFEAMVFGTQAIEAVHLPQIKVEQDPFARQVEELHSAPSVPAEAALPPDPIESAAQRAKDLARPASEAQELVDA